MAKLDFWYSIGSTYSYLSVMRLPDLARRPGCDVVWRPFNVRAIMIAQNNIPFADKPAKAAYMWRDIAGAARATGSRRSSPRPIPCRACRWRTRWRCWQAEEGWVEAYTQATYRRWFEGGDPAGEDPNLAAACREIGQDPLRVLEAARGARIEAALADATAEAMALGIFGSPSFVVAGELFWGDDRLEDAVEWAERGRLG